MVKKDGQTIAKGTNTSVTFTDSKVKSDTLYEVNLYKYECEIESNSILISVRKNPWDIIVNFIKSLFGVSPSTVVISNT